MSGNDFGNLFDIDISSISKKQKPKKTIKNDKAENAQKSVKHSKSKLSFDTIDDLRPYTINIFTERGKQRSCNFYKEKSAYVTDDPYVFGLRKKYDYEIVTTDLCENIEKCPNNFPTCSICKLKKKRTKR